MYDRQYFVYILATYKRGTLYVGISGDLIGRTWQHKNDVIDGFTKKYGVHKLVHYEIFEDVMEAIKREKQLKKWSRAWKIELIEKHNPHWKDLFDDL